MLLLLLFMLLFSAALKSEARLSIDPSESVTPKVEVRQLYARDLRQRHHQHRMRGGFVDFSDAAFDPETGKLCVIKDQTVHSLQKTPILHCDHKDVRQCHLTYVTKYEPFEEEVCEENFEKICQIVFRQVARNETVKKCYKQMDVVCDQHREYDPSSSSHKYNNNNNNHIEGQESCHVYYESVCTTRYKETQPGKLVGDTKCEKLPRKLCGKSTCKVIERPEECHDIVVAAVMDKPEETCDLNPQNVCRLQTKLVPKLEPVEECEYQPKEFCQMKFSAPRRVPKPLKIKWCLKGEDEKQDEEYPSPVIPAYLPPTYIAEASSRSDDNVLPKYSPAKYEAADDSSHGDNPLTVVESATQQPQHYYKQFSYDPKVNGVNSI